MEDEMVLDGEITAAQFDDTLDVGVVATSAGTLWYINWIERSSVRLVGSHGQKVMEKFSKLSVISVDSVRQLW